ncbi:MAG TPA: 2-C-methyl-D-erythritol 4-phosphate cytidylyltransferase [Chitinophagaceae bacterium]|nr:2-C-methyl-D-erythritol 4-phosphate cytidylyltransferase [Chitinophagaceae bacterium]MCC6634591.1 2-C-methyl-D-erythritol 4-phosphate cytidylyltransferase [Chitinophagaceae bacterium]HNE94167.1 2-C-methyl-D-erythritol 4-phosphate cytidylyltransferase [Chitinophagaceae bacterium]HNM35266.1 2-C-methyl-D-erythritol 4-phosphate cytidylyltransferase [Chitinophagaceae bacterium]HNN31975.1 2-C-methyl-D-erythritol 4-phosphate cytidylyltransferase [Chitinophagaceae bacterium]
MKKVAVIVAGGNGIRMGGFIPKQFLLLKGKPVLWFTINTFLNSYNDLEIILVLPEEFIERGREIIELFDEKSRITITKGGNTRFHSVQNGLQLIKEECIVFVHDGVRCLLSKNLIINCYQQALIKGNAVPAITATDSIRLVDENGNNSIADRNKIKIIQTPQTFKSNIILDAFKQPYKESFTDEASVVEATGAAIFLIDGEYNNIKITHPSDLAVAEKILEAL